MKTIYLTGFMGSGKTTVGRILGSRLGIPVIDIDEEIVSGQKKSINEIFRVCGESYFRDLETEILMKMPSEGTIVATGGGTIMRESNRLWMKKNGIVVFLDAPEGEILARLENDQSRPLIAGDKAKGIAERLAQRMPLYRKAADIHIRTAGKSPEEAANEILWRLNPKCSGHTC